MTEFRLGDLPKPAAAALLLASGSSLPEACELPDGRALERLGEGQTEGRKRALEDEWPTDSKAKLILMVGFVPPKNIDAP